MPSFAMRVGPLNGPEGNTIEGLRLPNTTGAVLEFYQTGHLQLSDEELDELTAHLQRLRGRPMPIDPLVSMARFLVMLWGSTLADLRLNTSLPSPPAYTGPPIVTAYCYQLQYARWPHDGRSDEMSWTRSFDIVAPDDALSSR